MVVAYGLMRVMGTPLPTPHVPVLAAPVMFLAFFVGAVAEEVGWSGYATDPMQARWSALRVGILLGLVWAAWHVVQLLELHRSPSWIAWWCLYTVAGRILTVWLYNGTGKSVFATVVFHAMANVSWQLFPNGGSHWDPRITGLLLALVAAMVTIVWGPRTLARPVRLRGPSRT
jgi:membrane protease YdiL (CAAX protease family)